MPKVNTFNYDTIASWNGSQDLFVVEQSDGTKVATPAMVKQYVLGNSIDDIYSVMGQMGAKNLIPYPYYESDHTESGITWTVNSDGSVTANGTATANSTFIFRQRTEQTKFVEKNTSYILSGCPSGGSSSKYLLYLFVKNQDDSNVAAGIDYGNGTIIDMPDQDYNGIYAFARVISGQTVSNLTFKPMLRLASDTDNTYQPYAMTNKQLTDELDTAREQISKLTTPTLLWEGDATAVGTTYNMTGNYTDYKYLLVTAKTNVEEKNMLIPTSRISANIIFPDFLSAGAWNTTTNAFTYNSVYGIKFTAANKFQLDSLTYNNANWVLRPRAIYGIG